MRRLIRIFGLLALIACTQAADIGVSPVTPLRDMSAPIASQVDVHAARLAGPWVVVGAFDAAPAGPRLGAQLRLSETGAGGLQLSSPGGSGDLMADGPGRWRAAGAGWLPDGPLWVLWMDADARTAIIGRPDGATAWIMDRNSSASPDRLAAARDILEWFGYDLARLEEVS